MSLRSRFYAGGGQDEAQLPRRGASLYIRGAVAKVGTQAGFQHGACQLECGCVLRCVFADGIHDPAGDRGAGGSIDQQEASRARQRLEDVERDGAAETDPDMSDVVGPQMRCRAGANVSRSTSARTSRPVTGTRSVLVLSR